MKGLDPALLIIRIGIGAIFIGHGSQKLFGVFGGNGIDAFAEALKNMGIANPRLMAPVAAVSEALGGVFVLLGIFPRIGAFLIAFTMVVAIVKVHGPNGFFAANGGFEYPFLILMACISLMIAGGGKLSLYNNF